MTVRTLLLLALPLLAAACTSDDEPSPSARRPQEVALSVTLWHCGVEPVTVDGRTWEVPATESVDGHPDLPLDATNTPTDWVGTGTADLAEEELTYTDEGGEVVTFVPDDGRPPGPCG